MKKKQDKQPEAAPAVQPVQSAKPGIETVKQVRAPQLVKGMKDILPVDQPYWMHIKALIGRMMDDYSFGRIDMPIVEDTSLFLHGLGKQTDIVEKEMYTFVDQGGNNLSLRPELTASFVRSYLEHGMLTWPQPVKLYAVGPAYRHDKPQEGRYRQFYQWSCEVIGEAKAAADAQLILIAYKFYTSLGLSPIMHINSIGCQVCRPAYREALTEYYKNKRSQICEDCKRRLTRNVMRLLDCKEQTCQEIKAKSPHMDEYRCDDCKNHFMSVLEYVDDFDIPYEYNHYLVRGLDYYSRTVFEFYIPRGDDEEMNMLAIGGGGRYDQLVELFGGMPTPAVGFAVGIERVILKLKEMQTAGEEIPIVQQRKIDIFIAQLGERAKRRMMVLYEELLKEGFAMAEAFTKDSLRAQLDLANKLGVKFTVILGEKELIDGTIIIRNMEGGEQEVIDSTKLIPTLRKKLDAWSQKTTS
ncbi:MAG: histidine--tRNA ligase [Patescibacteria group bacterium]